MLKGLRVAPRGITKELLDKMPMCQVIKGNDRACRNYARKGKTCCFPHRQLETEPCVPNEDDYESLVKLIKPDMDGDQLIQLLFQFHKKYPSVDIYEMVDDQIILLLFQFHKKYPSVDIYEMVDKLDKMVVLKV